MDYTPCNEVQTIVGSAACLICHKICTNTTAGFVINSAACYCKDCFEKYNARTLMLGIKYCMSYQDAVRHEARIRKARVSIIDVVGEGVDIDWGRICPRKELAETENFKCYCPQCYRLSTLPKKEVVEAVSNMGYYRCTNCNAQYTIPFFICGQCGNCVPIDVRSPEHTTCWQCGTSYSHARGVCRQIR